MVRDVAADPRGLDVLVHGATEQRSVHRETSGLLTARAQRRDDSDASGEDRDLGEELEEDGHASG
jgi:hypothetical protein